MRKTLVTLMCLAVVVPALAQAADPMKNALAAIPEDAVGFLCVPNVKQLDAEVQQSITNLGLQPFVSPPYNSPIALMQMFLQMTEGLDEDGPLVFVQMPFENIAEFDSKNALIFPATDAKKLVEAMGGQPAEGGMWNLTMFGKPAFAKTDDKRLIVSDTAEGVKAVAEGKLGIDSKLKAKDLTAFKGLDLVVWVDGERLLKTFKSQIDGITGMMLMMQGSGNPLAAKQAESTKRQIDMFVEGAKSITIGIALDQAGVGLRFAMSAKPGSELARQLKVKPIRGSLLQGLPVGKYMIAGGQVFSADQLKESIKQFEPYFEMGNDIESLDAEQLGILKGFLQDWAPLNRGVRFTIEALAPGPDGLIGLSVLFDTSDSGRWLELVGKAVDAAKKLSSDEDAQKFAKAISYTTEAEEIAGAKVTQLKLDLSKIEDVDEDDLEEVIAIMGKEGLLFRMAAVDSELVAISFGGGADYMKRLLEQAGKKDAPLDDTPGIVKLSDHLPKKKVSVVFAAMDQIVACIGNAVKVLDEDDEFPFSMPEINAPLALSTTGKDGTIQLDVFFPNELVVASKDLILTMTMMNSGGPGGPMGNVEVEVEGE